MFSLHTPRLHRGHVGALWFSSVSCVAALAAACVSQSESPSAVESKTLSIPARKQAAESPAAGWCAETAIQEALLYYGVQASQREINRAGRPSHPDIYWGDVETAFSNLGIRRRAWTGRGDIQSFADWVRVQVRAGKPVFAGVKLQPTEHPEWGLDHMVLIVGFDKEALHINTTWGRRERRTLEQLASVEGISLNNGRGQFFAYAIDGVRSK